MSIDNKTLILLMGYSNSGKSIMAIEYQKINPKIQIIYGAEYVKKIALKKDPHILDEKETHFRLTMNRTTKEYRNMLPEEFCKELKILELELPKGISEESFIKFYYEHNLKSIFSALVLVRFLLTNDIIIPDVRFYEEMDDYKSFTDKGILCLITSVRDKLCESDLHIKEIFNITETKLIKIEYRNIYSVEYMRASCRMFDYLLESTMDKNTKISIMSCIINQTLKSIYGGSNPIVTIVALTYLKAIHSLPYISCHVNLEDLFNFLLINHPNILELFEKEEI